ncbi:MAG: T9SS type A sorting domain-containing protein, partial [Bacteroidetes bacterium]|nr:T9SS type A sorting domain-containing protein [Bacteroidota bacterium]
EYQGYVRGKIGITLYDLTGRKVFEKNEVVSQPEEVYKNMINPGPIPAGMYNLVFRVGDLRIVRRVIKE